MQPGATAHHHGPPPHAPASHRPPPHHVSPSHRPPPGHYHTSPRYHERPGYYPHVVHHYHYTYYPERHVYVYHHVRPYHGVFVYGPAPVYHHHYVGTPAPEVREEHVPERKVDREDSLAVGLRGGSFLSGYDSAAGFADPGLGLNVRYRPDEAVGLELAVSRYGMQSDDSQRSNTVAQGSVELFAWPWTRVSPYVLGGLTYDARGFDDAYYDFNADSVERFATADALWGPHAGLGLELALGKSVAVDLEARYTGFLTAGSDDPTLPGALQTSVGALVHF